MRCPKILCYPVIAGMIAISGLAHAEKKPVSVYKSIKTSTAEYKTYAMILVGLGLIGMSARRRK